MSVFSQGQVAVITGAASGIGRAAAARLAGRCMKLCLFDRNADQLAQLAASLPATTRAVVGDVSKFEDVERLRDAAFEAFGAVHLLMNNAAIGHGSKSWGALDRWASILDVNLWGVIHGVHAFTEPMLAQGAPAAIVNTGSKQGITNPPGDPAYAVAKAGVRVLTEQLAHDLRNVEGGRVSAHLLVPGWTFTGLTAGEQAEKPAGAWTPDQVVERMIGAVEAGEFYVYCPDNVVSEALDALRLQWSVGDIIEKRPALSRWHPDWKARFEAFAAERLS
ncbi:MAG: SDR family NAD(P)-dependent oxidoreductase [Pseudomonadota bacterium]|nr:SDR family NAD(P)-dependent oxidoreductase [Pseudomonadota bacterium]